jgi:hypothetical protein
MEHFSLNRKRALPHKWRKAGHPDKRRLCSGNTDENYPTTFGLFRRISSLALSLESIQSDTEMSILVDQNGSGLDQNGSGQGFRGRFTLRFQF